MAFDMICEETSTSTRKPAIYEKARGACRWCKASLTIGEGRRNSAKFCNDECRYAFNNHRKTQGAAIVAQVIRWRMAKGAKERGKQLTLLYKMAKDLVEMDEELGVTYLAPAPTHFHAKIVARNIAGNKRRKAST